MKRITESSLYFSVIGEESSIQSWSPDTTDAGSLQTLTYTPGHLYVFQETQHGAMDALVTAERTDDDLQVTFRSLEHSPSTLMLKQFFTHDGQLHLLKPDGEFIRSLSAHDQPQSGPVAFDTLSLGTIEQQPQQLALGMLHDVMLPSAAVPAEPAHADIQPQLFNSQPTADITPVSLMNLSLLQSTSPAITGALDQVGTRQGALASGSVTDDKLAELQGTGRAGAILEILDNGVVIGETLVDASGQWSFTPEERLAESGHMFAARDKQSGESSNNFVLIVDSVAPSRVLIDSITDDRNGNALVASGQQTADNTPTIGGRAEAFSMVAIYSGKTLIGTSFADATGAWSFSSAFTFPDGDYSITAKAIDFSGNTGLASTAYKITIDTIPPAVPVILQAADDVGPQQGPLAAGALTDDRTPTLSGKAEAGVTVFVYDNGQLLGTAEADASGNWSFTPSVELKDGEHLFTTTARDKAGNLSTRSDAFTLLLGEDRAVTPTIDAVIDNVGTLQGALLSGADTDDATPTLRGQAQAGDTVRIFDRGALIGETLADTQGRWQFTPATDLREGAHSFQVQAVNASHSASALSPAFELLLDLTPPDATNLRITGAYDDTGNITGNIASGSRTDDRTPTLSGTGPAGETVIIYVTDASGQREIGRVSVGNDGRWSLTSHAALNYGINTFSAVAIDRAGNATPHSPDYSVTVTTNDTVGGFDLTASQSTLINTTVQGNQNNPQVTKLANGNLVVVWQQNQGNGYDVMMQLMDPTGTHKLGQEQFVNQRNPKNQDSPQVIALADGGFLIVFESYQGALDPDGSGVLARRYGADGGAHTDEFLVNQSTIGDQRAPGALALPDGGYILSWYSDQDGGSIVQRIYTADNKPASNEVVIKTGGASHSYGGPEMVLFEHGPYAGWYLTVWCGQDGNGDGVLGQLRKIDGSAVGPIRTLNTTTDLNQQFPDAIVLKDGSFVVFWDSNDSQTTGRDIRAAHYHFDPVTNRLASLGDDFIVNDYRAGKQYKPVGVALDDGGYLLVWGSEGGDGNGSAIYAQRFDANSHKVGHEFLVNPSTWGNQGSGWDDLNLGHILDATLLDNGNIFVTWNSDKIDSDGYGIEGVVIDPDAGFYSEFTVNTTKTNDQSYSSTTALPGGGFVVVWESTQTGDPDVMAQVFDAAGMPVGGEFRVNTVTADFQGRPDVITLSDGTFLVGFHSWEGGRDIVHTQRYGYTYDAAGQVSGAVRIGSEQLTSQAGIAVNRNVQMTALDDGGYMLVWQGWNGGSTQWQVLSAQYDAKGNQVPGTQTLVANRGFDGFTDSVSKAVVTTLDNGQVVVSYSRDTAGNVDSDVYFRVYNPLTHTYGNEVRTNQTIAGDQGTPGVAKLSNGKFIVTWHSNDNSGPDQSGWGVWGRVYNANGTPAGNEFLVNSYTPGDQQRPITIARPGGGFVAMYCSRADSAPGEGTFGIYAQFFDDAGHRIGQEMRINQLVAGDQQYPDMTFLEDGRLFVTWSDNGVADGSGLAVKGRIIDLDTTLGLGVTPQNAAVGDSSPQAFGLADGADHSSLWMLFDDGSTSGLLLSSESLSAVRGGAGNDTIGIRDTAFTAISGGDGIDTLLLDGKNMALDLDTLIDRISGIEKIDLGQGKANSLSLSASALDGLGQVDMVVADGKNQFVINGDGSNSLQLLDTQAENWVDSGTVEAGGVVYHTWTAGNTELLVEQTIQVTVL